MDVRIDKWLWAVRIYKSRSLATAACSAGKVRIAGEALKPSRSVRVGDIITATTGELTRTVRVVAPLERRVGAKLVGDYMEDLTPPSEYQKPREPNFRPLLLRPKGTGRPTKKERRKIDELL
ncbi:MAG TPA: RNA-binding S4 domain-containing protein [Verrucomicrobiae bacterium]|nr:RNA-binding S4 domain-containing protein [Verrucomicrobiae bacterium]